MFVNKFKTKSTHNTLMIRNEFEEVKKDLDRLEVNVMDLTERGIATRYQKETSVEELLLRYSRNLKSMFDLALKFDPLELEYYKGLHEELYSRWGMLSAIVKNIIFTKAQDLNINPSVTLIDSLERGSIPELLTISYDNFLEGLEKLPQEVLKTAYTYVLTKFLKDITNKVFITTNTHRILADDLHNLPLALEGDLKDFKHDYFWGTIFTYEQRKNYILEAFFTSLVVQQQH